MFRFQIERRRARSGGKLRGWRKDVDSIKPRPRNVFGRVCQWALAALVAPLGGCPQPQQPDGLPVEDEHVRSTAPSMPGSHLPGRPVTAPPIQTAAQSTSQEAAAPQPAGPGSGPQSATAQVFEPATNLVVRPGQAVKVRWGVQSTSGTSLGGAIVLARDDDKDQKPDGSPVLELPVSVVPGSNEWTLATDRPEVVALLQDGLAHLRIGVRVSGGAGSALVYAGGGLTIDAVVPEATWLSPETDLLTNRVPFPVSLSTMDNGAHSLRIELDADLVPQSGNEVNVLDPVQVKQPGATQHDLMLNLPNAPAGIYYLRVTISDGAAPQTSFYATGASGVPLRLRLTDRWVGDVAVDSPASTGDGAILQGFNFNDLAGSSMVAVPDVNFDGYDELLIGARFGKAHLFAYEGVGPGEAYLIYGGAQRLGGAMHLNSTGKVTPGVTFPGIRTPMAVAKPSASASVAWTEGLSDIAIVPDMDGDSMPELVFGFPRAESVSLANASAIVQHPDLVPDLGGMGSAEFDAYYDAAWHPNQAQFTRGGVVIVSSHDELLRDAIVVNRKFDRVIDLHEVGQLFAGFDGMRLPSPVAYIKNAVRRDELPPPRDGTFFVCVDCDGLPPSGCQPSLGQCGNDNCTQGGSTTTDGRERAIPRWVMQWDVFLGSQPPGGFSTQWTPVPADPPLSNLMPFSFGPGMFPLADYPNLWGAGACKPGIYCEVTNEWYVWSDPCIGVTGWAVGGTPWQDPLPDCYPNNPCAVPGSPPPCGDAGSPCALPPMTVNAGHTSLWTGFYGPCSEAFVATPAGEFPAPIGARILGQKVDDRFGSSTSCDGTWLYMSAPLRTPNDAPYINDVPSLTTPRPRAGVVYQLRTHAADTTGITLTQLWIEPQPSERWLTCFPIAVAVLRPWFPFVDTELGFRADSTMPVPHQYIIESIGSLRGTPTGPPINPVFGDPNNPFSCPPPYDPGISVAYDLSSCGLYDYPPGTAGYNVDHTPQIVGPHTDARVGRVRAVGDVNGDGVRDFVVGSEHVREHVLSGGGATVGGVFVVFGRPTGIEGDYLLDQLAVDIGHPSRLYGVLLKGAAPGEKLGHVFADAGDVNGDGYGDVIIGNESANGGAGEAVLLFGSPSLVSPGQNDPGGAPGGGWTPATIPAGRIVRFVGAPGDNMGTNVEGAGDVDGDGYSDVLIAASGAADGRGMVYLVYGGPSLPGTVNLATLTTAQVDVPFARFAGRANGDQLGGGVKPVTGTDPSGGVTIARAQGLALLGDLDGDGAAEMALGAMTADANGKTDAGEVYLIYGRRGP